VVEVLGGEVVAGLGARLQLGDERLSLSLRPGAVASAVCRAEAVADYGTPRWARQDSNLDLTDYESAALTD
jgi:hypothetical protein